MLITTLLPPPFGGRSAWDPVLDPPTPAEQALLLPSRGRRTDALRRASLRAAAPTTVLAARVVAQRALGSAVAPYFAQGLLPVERFTVGGHARAIDHDVRIATTVQEFDLLLREVLGGGVLGTLLLDTLLREFRDRHFAARVAAASAALILSVAPPLGVP